MAAPALSPTAVQRQYCFVRAALAADDDVRCKYATTLPAQLATASLVLLVHLSLSSQRRAARRPGDGPARSALW